MDNDRRLFGALDVTLHQISDGLQAHREHVSELAAAILKLRTHTAQARGHDLKPVDTSELERFVADAAASNR